MRQSDEQDKDNYIRMPNEQNYKSAKHFDTIRKDRKSNLRENM